MSILGRPTAVCKRQVRATLRRGQCPMLVRLLASGSGGSAPALTESLIQKLYQLA